MNSFTKIKLENDYQVFLNELKETINQKYSAKHRYQQLIHDSNNHQTEVIATIMEDENKHYEQLSDMYQHLTGRKPDPVIFNDWFKNSEEDFSDLFKAEQKNVKLYLNLSTKAPTPLFRRQFERAAAEEQNHAVWFLYLLTEKNSKRT
ncbi:ferritin-like domain-containing protein [Salipaludibacillus daqingensis]|uniref:ferritin-like domain-containing protein n=1 Tax=Salipaludibacillus daqingensis TaxID=3041001 RepID=UPI0024749FE5|nr:ferritin-like domain-containing protein [Salipaludibacillus daqingensis]